jgi:predicted membrane chloride channel (bestrophin family)
VLLPFGLLREFDALNAFASGWMKGHMVWLVIPFSVMVSWMYTTLEQVGASTENPFEGGANDVPISQVSRMIEVELRGCWVTPSCRACSTMNNIILDQPASWQWPTAVGTVGRCAGSAMGRQRSPGASSPIVL